MSKVYLLACLLFLHHLALDAQGCKTGGCNCHLDSSWSSRSRVTIDSIGETFIRFYNKDSNFPVGCWFTTERDVKGEYSSMPCAEYIQSRYALPYTPTSYVCVQLPAHQAVYMGQVATFRNMPGGGLQYCIIGKCDMVNFEPCSSGELISCK